MLPYSDMSIVLDRHSNALHLIQRLRDEAHRFAITHHRSLRGKASVASRLDGVPGVGPRAAQGRAQALQDRRGAEERFARRDRAGARASAERRRRHLPDAPRAGQRPRQSEDPEFSESEDALWEPDVVEAGNAGFSEAEDTPSEPDAAEAEDAGFSEAEEVSCRTGQRFGRSGRSFRTGAGRPSPVIPLLRERPPHRSSRVRESSSKLTRSPRGVRAVGR